MSSRGHASDYIESGGTKLQVVYPPGLAAKFNYVGVKGAMNVDMANFGTF